ncbi:MAG TPA: DUF1573 domain-containing protein [Pyrinomonadaceae bacterium]|nr:DUF1573 domain-containing protein [Pyrinomonadaceae bacterium]
MNTNFLKLSGVLALTAFAQSARAELKWEQTSVDLRPAFNDKQAVAHFKYENVGNTPIHFKSVHASCGCTTAQTQNEQVAPGQKGEITATFNIGGRTGTQVKTVTVQTDDPEPSTIVLTLKAVITPLLELQPTLVYWQNGEEPKPKIITAKANKDAAIKKLDVASSTPDFTAKVDAGSAPNEFRISVQPRDTTKAVYATLTIKPDSPANTGNMFAAAARVMPPAPTNKSTLSTIRHDPATPTPTAGSPRQ